MLFESCAKLVHNHSIAMV